MFFFHVRKQQGCSFASLTDREPLRSFRFFFLFFFFLFFFCRASFFGERGYVDGYILFSLLPRSRISPLSANVTHHNVTDNFLDSLVADDYVSISLDKDPDHLSDPPLILILRLFHFVSKTSRAPCLGLEFASFPDIGSLYSPR